MSNVLRGHYMKVGNLLWLRWPYVVGIEILTQPNKRFAVPWAWVVFRKSQLVVPGEVVGVSSRSVSLSMYRNTICWLNFTCQPICGIPNMWLCGEISLKEGYPLACFRMSLIIFLIMMKKKNVASDDVNNMTWCSSRILNGCIWYSGIVW